jgi:hypothetical protein
MITQWHIPEEIVTSQVDVMDYFAQVVVEIRIGQAYEVVQGILGNVTLPLEFAFALFTNGPQFGLFIHPLGERLGNFQALSWSRHYKKAKFYYGPLFHYGPPF